MYVPSAFAVNDPDELQRFLRRHSFAVLTSRQSDGLFATHLPLIFDPEPAPHGRLIGHMARANPQWRDPQGEVMAVFSGPHAYISPTWYEQSETVPTWNYVAVHVYGTFHVVDDDHTLLDILRRSVSIYESRMPEPWSFGDSDPYVAKLLKALVGFRIEITRIEGKAKLSQNQTPEIQERVISHLSRQSDEGSRNVAALMRELRP